MGWSAVFSCWVVFAAKMLLPFFAGRLLMLANRIRPYDVAAVLRIRVALIPLEQWLTVLVLWTAVYLVRRAYQRRGFQSVASTILGWLPVVVAICIVLHEWCVQYRGAIEMIGVRPREPAGLFSPLEP